MNLQLLSQALVRLSEYKIGVAEAALLCTIGFLREASNEAILLLIDVEPSLLHGRTQTLRKKTLVTTQFRANGRAFHKTTRRGDELIKRILGEK